MIEKVWKSSDPVVTDVARRPAGGGENRARRRKKKKYALKVGDEAKFDTKIQWLLMDSYGKRSDEDEGSWDQLIGHQTIIERRKILV